MLGEDGSRSLRRRDMCSTVSEGLKVREVSSKWKDSTNGANEDAVCRYYKLFEEEVKGRNVD